MLNLIIDFDTTWLLNSGNVNNNRWPINVTVYFPKYKFKFQYPAEYGWEFQDRWQDDDHASQFDSAPAKLNQREIALFFY